MLAVPKPSLSVQGALKTFDDRGDSGNTLHRRFCPECGSSIMSESEVLPDLAIVMAGTLDDASWVRPTMEIYCDSAQPWVQLGGERQRFAKNADARIEQSRYRSARRRNEQNDDLCDLL